MKNLQDVRDKLTEALPKIKRYLPLMFGCLLLLIYGFLVYRVSSLNGATPTAADSSQQTAQVPHIDPKLVEQLQNLQDNSSSVQTLFDQTRDNPFQ